MASVKKMRSSMTDEFNLGWKEQNVKCEWLVWLGQPMIYFVPFDITKYEIAQRLKYADC